MNFFNFVRSRATLLLLLGASMAAGSRTADAATIVIVNNDGAGEGFNDPTPRAAVPGNPGVTLGQQRLNVFQAAANIWGGILTSSVTITVRAQFDPLTCAASSAVLGSAGPTTIHRDFPGVPLAGHWYHQALANKLTGSDQSAANPDINATFNSNIDAGCFGPGLVWYYGTDGNEGANIELLPVVLHELGHGLGFSTTTNGANGAFNSSFPGVWDHFLMDNTNGLHWDQMTPAQRVASAIALDHLVWDGPWGIAEATTLAFRAKMVINTPAGIAGQYQAQAASFGAALTLAGVTDDVVLATDGTAPVNDICEPITNAAAIAGKFALVDRGICSFVAKALAVQAAGATGLIVVNNVASGLPGMGGVDPSITIPCIGISQADGNAIKANLGSGVTVTMGLNSALRAGADASGRPLMYSPNPFAAGSSVSHWDISLAPNALMEPAINADLHNTIDLAHGLFVDIGWFRDATDAGPDEIAASRAITMEAPVPNPATSSTSVAFRIGTAGRVKLTITDVSGHTVRRLHDGFLTAGGHQHNWDGRTERGGMAPAGVYFIRLQTSAGARTQRVTFVR